MRQETARLIVEAAAEYGREVADRPGYSGRSMYGAVTCAVVGNRADIEVSVLLAAFNLGVSSVADGDDCPDVVETLEDLEGLRWDSMGRDDSVCY